MTNEPGHLTQPGLKRAICARVRLRHVSPTLSLNDCKWILYNFFSLIFSLFNISLL